MEPIRLDRKDGEDRLLHRCIACGHEKMNRTDAKDDFEAIVALARRLAEKS